MPHGEAELERAFGAAFEEAGIELPHEVRKALAVGFVKAVEYTGEKLRDADLTERFRHERITTAIVTAVVVAALCIPVTYVLSTESQHDTRALAHKNALSNCEVARTARPQGNARAFDLEIILYFLQQAITPKKALPGQTIKPKSAAEKRAFEAFFAIENQKLRFWRQFTVVKDKQGHVIGNELPAKLTEYDQLEKSVAPTPLLDCRTLVSK